MDGAPIGPVRGPRIAQAGDWVVVEVAPAAALQVSFEDLTGGMLKLPYYRDTAACSGRR